MFSDLGEVALCRRLSMGLCITPLRSPELFVLDCSLCELCESFYCGGTNYCGQIGKWGWPSVQLAASTCLV